MTVAELIEKLKAMPQDLPAIVGQCPESNCTPEANVESVDLTSDGGVRAVLISGGEDFWRDGLS